MQRLLSLPDRHDNRFLVTFPTLIVIGFDFVNEFFHDLSGIAEYSSSDFISLHQSRAA